MPEAWMVSDDSPLWARNSGGQSISREKFISEISSIVYVSNVGSRRQARRDGPFVYALSRKTFKILEVVDRNGVSLLYEE